MYRVSKRAAEAQALNVAFGLNASSKPPTPTRPNHQPLRRPRGPHIEQPRFLALVFALGGHAPGAHQRHHRELQPFADVQRHHLDAVVRGVEHAG